MKTKISLYLAILTLVISGTVYAQEVATEPENPNIVIPAEIETPRVVIPAEAETLSAVIPTETETPSVVIPAKMEIQDQNIPKETPQEFQVLVSEDISTSTPKEDTATFLIRNGATVLFEGDIALATTSDSIQVPDLEGDMHTVPSNSVLALLLQVDVLSDVFLVNKLNYYDSFGAFYLKCIQIESDELCENWQYVLNNVSPWTGIDQTLVSSGDTVGIYFGSSYQVIFSTSTYYVDTPFTATAQYYNYQDNTWNARTSVTLGVTVPDPSNPWSPIELQTSSVNAQGESLFTIATSGDYMIGVQEDYYYPSYLITVSSSTATSTDTDNGGSGSSNEETFNVSSAISFIKNLQGTNGSYGNSELYSDWVAIAFGAHGTNDSALINYLKSKASIKSILTDNERRAMALLALGKNPYNFEGVNYIKVIIEDFDGTQFGERSLVNDDIFALIVLSEVGYESGDIEIQKAIEFILQKQNSNGSFESSVDLTSAAIQALLQFEDVNNVSSAIAKAKSFLKNEQESNGGWDNVYATSWALQAMNALGESWSKNGNLPEDYLANEQQTDGGVLNFSQSKNDRIWATSYAIPAVLGKSWNDILRSVSRPKEKISSGSSDDFDSEETATTTIPLFEEIGEVATSTLIADVQLLASEYVEKVNEKTVDNEVQESVALTSTPNSNEQNSNEEKATSWISTIASYVTKTISGLMKGILEWF